MKFQVKSRRSPERNFSRMITDEYRYTGNK